MSKSDNQNPISPIDFFEPVPFINVDEWTAEPEDYVFRTIKGAIIADVSSFYKMEPNQDLDMFIMSPKRSYNNPEMREHIIHYLNYFEKFYDTDHELLLIYCRLKYLIDYEKAYTTEAFLYDLQRYIMSGSISFKIGLMNKDNYSLHLTYRNIKNPNLQYNDRHGQVMMKVSVIMNCMIPLMCHFMYSREIKNSTEFILAVYDILIDSYSNKYGIDIYNKLYETAISNILHTTKRNQTIWDMQDIRGINTTIHSLQSVQNILINITPKYRYDGNLVHLNYKSILKNTGFQILDIGYEYAFVSLSSSRRDEDLNSEFDKYESFLERADEALLIQNQVASDDAMQTIRMIYGPFTQEEIQFYKHRLSDGVKCTINSFQKDLIFNLFFKYFGDTNTINAINLDDYIVLLIAAKKILKASGMILLPYIVSSKVVRLATRKNVNKKELTKIESSPLWGIIKEKYKNEKIEKHILGIIATILTSEFRIIDPEDAELDGKKISVVPELISEEILMYVTLI